MLNAMEVPTLNLAAMGIGEEHYEAIEKVVKELDRQGISVKIENNSVQLKKKSNGIT